MLQIVTVITASESYQCPLGMEHFCWNIIAYICENLPTSLFEVHRYLLLIQAIGCIFKSYRTKHLKLQDTSEVSGVVQFAENPPPNVLTYFRWVAGIYEFLQEWEGKFLRLQVSAENIELYKSHLSDLESVATSVGATYLCLKRSFVQDTERKLYAVKGRVNSLLLFFLEDTPQKW